MRTQFIASFSLIGRDSTTKDLLMQDLGVPLEHFPADPDYVFSDKIPGCKHFGIWPLAQAARACFGIDQWPSEHPIPQACIEFEVESEDAVARAERELLDRGRTLLHGTRKEPWGQTICRLLSAEGVILGVSYAPWMH